MIMFECVRDFHPGRTFECGQCFRWTEEADGSYTGVVAGQAPVNVSFLPGEEEDCGSLRIESAEGGAPEAFWKRYFDLERDYKAILSELTAGDDVMTRAAGFGRGLRILRQDPWETLLSFILSQNNNIGRIKKCVDDLSRQFGQHAGAFRGKDFYHVPAAERLAELTETDLSVCRLGYRAKYIIETAKTVAEDGGTRLAALGSGEEHEDYAYLTGLCGVGPKVADCIMLFAGGWQRSFPIDVWVKEAMHSLYALPSKDLPGMRVFAEKRFGEHGGIAQQYLFYYMKSMPKQKAEKKKC